MTLTRLGTLPQPLLDADLTLELSDARIQFAYTDEAVAYVTIVTYEAMYTDQDVTKYQFTRSCRVFNAATGEEVQPGKLRSSQYVYYYDPVGLGTDPTITPDQAIIADSLDMATKLQAWVTFVTGTTPLHQLVATDES